MNALIDSLGKFSGTALLALAVAVGVLTCSLIIIGVRLARLRKAMGPVLQGAKGENLERMLYEHLRSQVSVDQEMTLVKARLDALEARVDTAKRFTGLLRFDAFPDIGGQQSFAFAIYDDLGNGAVISSLVGRANARVYCKVLREGRSDIELSTEEKRAIEFARSRGAARG